MRSVELDYSGDGLTPRQAYDRIRDFARYPDLVDVVRSVTVRPSEAASAVLSDWEVDFRNGVLAWSEEDVFDDAALRIEFRQTEGDFESFEGRWEVTPTARDGARVRFTAAFDFGLPSLAGIIDPVAERVLRETIEDILRALLDDGPAGADRVAA
ncbi:type II toxin-antitoxin system RatA family toxin [Streptomyces sp. NPDC088794]|uniref:type II toxin-antitoxin system RatA family toxin n=1 Tax=Streptomyces sp. NPDC088794 TaxID=3365902 RepID=UPI00382B447E